MPASSSSGPAEPPKPSSYTEILEMLEQGRTPPGIRVRHKRQLQVCPYHTAGADPDQSDILGDISKQQRSHNDLSKSSKMMARTAVLSLQSCASPDVHRAGVPEHVLGM